MVAGDTSTRCGVVTGSAVLVLLSFLLLQPALLFAQDEKDRESCEMLIVKAEEYGRARPYDPVGLRELYLAAMKALPASSFDYRLAYRRAQELSRKIKEAYLYLADRDAGTFEFSDEEARRFAHQLGSDLKSSHSLIRARAALYLARLGSFEGAAALVNALAREKDDEVRDEIVGALVAIGGEKVCDLLGRKIAKAGLPAQNAALVVLQALIYDAKGEEAKHPSVALGYFVFSDTPSVVSGALTTLENAGGSGVWGLMNAITVQKHLLRLRVIKSLGETGEGRAADVLATFLVFGVKDRMDALKKAASASIIKIGVPCIPYLFRFYDDPRRRQWTKFVVYKITGKSFEYADQLKAWWSRRSKREGSK